MTWLVTGGAGYIGGHVVRALREADLPVVVLDDLSTGRRNRVPADVPLINANVSEKAKVVAAMGEHQIHGVIHLAAKKAVSESVEQPLRYYRDNIGGLESLLEAMLEARVDWIVLSSSCSVIGTSDEAVTEESPTQPESPYGETKLVCEWLLRDVARATGMRYVILRYFNVAGAQAPGAGRFRCVQLDSVGLPGTLRGSPASGVR